MAANPGPTTRRSDLTLQVPPRPGGFSSSRSGNGSSSAAGLFRGFSFKKKTASSDGERSSLLNSDPKAAPESPALSNLTSWQRCTSLPVTPASNLSPQITVPASARTLGEMQRSRVILHLNSLTFYNLLDIYSDYYQVYLSLFNRNVSLKINTIRCLKITRILYIEVLPYG